MDDSDDSRRMRSRNVVACVVHQSYGIDEFEFEISSSRRDRPSISSTVPESLLTVRSSDQSRSSLIRLTAFDWTECPSSVSIELRELLKKQFIKAGLDKVPFPTFSSIINTLRIFNMPATLDLDCSNIRIGQDQKYHGLLQLLLLLFLTSCTPIQRESHIQTENSTLVAIVVKSVIVFLRVIHMICRMPYCNTR